MFLDCRIQIAFSGAFPSLRPSLVISQKALTEDAYIDQISDFKVALPFLHYINNYYSFFNLSRAFLKPSNRLSFLPRAKRRSAHAYSTGFLHLSPH